MRLLHQLGGLAEICVRACSIHQSADFTLADDRTGKHCVTRLTRSGQRFSGQRGLVHFDGITLQQPRVRRHDVAQADADDVARHQLPRRRGDPLAIARHPGLDCEPCLQGGYRIARLVFFPETDEGVGQKQHKDDAEVRPMSGDRGKHHRRLDHPRDGTPKVAEEFQDLVGVLFDNLVGSVLGQPLFRLDLGEAVRRRCQFLFHLQQGQGLQIILGTGFRGRP